MEHHGSVKSKICGFHPFQQNLPHTTAQSAAGPSCWDPKLVYGGPCMQKSAGRPSILSQDTTQSLWTLPWCPQGTLDPAKANLENFYRFPAKFVLPHARSGAQRFFATPKPACRGPCVQKSAERPSIMSQDTTQSLWDPTVGSLGHPGSSKTQLSPFSCFFGGPGNG